MIDGWIVRRERHYVCTLDVHALMESQSAPDVRHIYQSASIVTPDGVPLVWFPVLREATPEQRARYEIGGGGVSLHWPDLDEDLSIAGLMAGVDWRSA